MSVPAQQALVQWLAFLVCVAAGWAASSLFRMPKNPQVWLLMVAAIFIIGFLPFLAFTVPIAGVPVEVRLLIWGFAAALAVGMRVRESQRQR